MPETNPYTPPEANIEIPQSNRRKATKLAKVGAWLQIAPLLGIIGTIVGMSRAFAALGKEMANEDVGALSAAIGEVLVATSIGFLGGLLGFILLCVAVFIQKRQPRWVWVMFWISSLPAIYMIGMLLLALGRGVG